MIATIFPTTRTAPRAARRGRARRTDPILLAVGVIIAAQSGQGRYGHRKATTPPGRVIGGQAARRNGDLKYTAARDRADQWHIRRAPLGTGRGMATSRAWKLARRADRARLLPEIHPAHDAHQEARERAIGCARKPHVAARRRGHAIRCSLRLKPGRRGQAPPACRVARERLTCAALPGRRERVALLKRPGKRRPGALRVALALAQGCPARRESRCGAGRRTRQSFVRRPGRERWSDRNGPLAGLRCSPPPTDDRTVVLSYAAT